LLIYDHTFDPEADAWVRRSPNPNLPTEDFERFQERLRRETAHPGTTGCEDGVSPRSAVWAASRSRRGWWIGQGQPAPLNQAFLERLADPLVVPELSVFNIELNTPPLGARRRRAARMHDNLESLWQRCQRVAAELDATVALIGILPTLRDTDLTLDHMS
jgi:hypothetical protein